LSKYIQNSGNTETPKPYVSSAIPVSGASQKDANGALIRTNGRDATGGKNKRKVKS